MLATAVPLPPTSFQLNCWACVSMAFDSFIVAVPIFFHSDWLLSELAIVEATNSAKTGNSLVTMTVSNYWKKNHLC